MFEFNAVEGEQIFVPLEVLIPGIAVDADKFDYKPEGPSRGGLRINGNEDLVYTPDASDAFLREGDVNPDDFTISVIDKETGETAATYDVRANVEGVTDTPIPIRDSVQIIVSHGQSLSIGFNNTTAEGSNNRPIVSPQSQFPEHVLTIDTYDNKPRNIGWKTSLYDSAEMSGFQPLQQRSFETHASGMSEAVIARHLEAGQAPPAIVTIMGGSGGKVIQELALGSSDRFDSLEAALASTVQGDLFVVPSGDGRYDIRANTGNGASEPLKTLESPPVYMDNIVNQVADAVATAERLGKSVETDLYLPWLQGQANSRVTFVSTDDFTLTYGDVLDWMVDRLDTQIAAATGIDFEIKVLVNQIAGFANKDVPLHQLGIAAAAEDALYFGVAEHAYQTQFSANQETGNDVHLTRLGYRLMGEEIGHRIADLMLEGDTQPILIESLAMDGNELVVSFSGVDGVLEADPLFYSRLAFDDAADPNTIDALGFSLRDAETGQPFGEDGPEILQAEVDGPASVRLTLDSPLTEPVTLRLGERANFRFEADDPELVAAVARDNPDASPEEQAEIAAEIATGMRMEGTPLRSSEGRAPVTVLAQTPDAERDDSYVLDDLMIHEYAPIQSFTFDPAELAPPQDSDDPEPEPCDGPGREDGRFPLFCDVGWGDGEFRLGRLAELVRCALDRWDHRGGAISENDGLYANDDPNTNFGLQDEACQLLG
ncbi:MAG: hypothetical protein ACFBRM_01470 [Pikeienuella sp.]